jgi:glycosyltransferase involved in cell wall biosynthesis
MTKPQQLSLSLVTCSLQQRRYLDATLCSVLNQDYRALEYIVIDGGSTDGSADLIKTYAPRLAYWVSEPDSGQTDALIKGFAHAQGEIQGWLCSDDLLLPGALDSVNLFFQRHPQVQAVYGDALWIDARGRFIRPKKEIAFNRFIFLHDHNYIPQPSMFWRRSLYDAVGGLDPRFNLAMDGDLWERFSRRTRIAHLPCYLSCMRSYAEQKTRAMRPQGRTEEADIRLRGKTNHARAIGDPARHYAARVLRIGAKALRGGYNATVSAEHLTWLEQLAHRQLA